MTDEIDNKEEHFCWDCPYASWLEFGNGAVCFCPKLAVYTYNVGGPSALQVPGGREMLRITGCRVKSQAQEEERLELTKGKWLDEQLPQTASKTRQNAI